MRLLVTGGAGFIGSNFIRYWLSRNADDELVNVDLLTYAGDLATLADTAEQHGNRYRFLRADIADVGSIDKIVQGEKPDVIVNFAAESHNSRAIVDPGLFVRTNIVGTHSILEAARRHGIERVHHISTCEVYGDLALESEEAFTEDSPYRPRTPYNASKAAADLLARSYYHTFGVPLTISVSSNNYGPWQYPEKVIPLFVTNALDDRPLPLYRHSANRREWLHVDDHCRAIEAIIRRGRIGETYNVGSGEERSVEDVADAILKALRKPHSLKTYVEDRPGHDRRYLLDHGKIERELGWRPEMTFDEALPATISWYTAHRAWWESKEAQRLDEFAWAAEPTQFAKT
jgi:dTDP-glucose 4,6-dehydratase